MPIWRLGVMSWLSKKILDPLLQILKKGAEPRLLAFSTALGLTLGLFPICGAAVFLCAMAIAVLRHRCHAPSIMLANFIATPAEISMVIPFLRLGEAISGGAHFPLTADAFKKVVTGQASKEILIAVSHALLGWAVAIPFIFSILFILFIPSFEFLVQKFRPPVTPKEPHPSTDIKLKVRDL